MKTLSHEEKIKHISNIFWDYHINPEEYLDIVEGRRPGHGWTTRERILVRMLERLQWYVIVAFFGIDKLKDIITPEIINRFRFPSMRHKYDHIRKILHGEPVSGSGWSAERREEIRHSLLSNRWYRAL